MITDKLRQAATLLDQIGSEADDLLKAAERAILASKVPRQDEQETQKLGAISRIVWEAHRQLLKSAIPAADRLEAGQ